MTDPNIPLPQVFQQPPPGEAKVLYCGDCICFTLDVSAPLPGRAWVRTNLGAADITRREIILRVEKNEIKLGAAWYDIEMIRQSNGQFKSVLPLHQTGFFQAKCFFIPDGTTTPVWQPGTNTLLNVEPAGTCCANIIYNAFVRQFGPSRMARSHTVPAEEDSTSAMIETLDKKGYTVIPESGKFRDLKQEIPFIFSQLGCRALHLLPIHPTPTTYARMGRFGSPYAALDFTDVDPALAEFDPAATPLEQFMELVDTVHQHNGYLLLDIAINHTGWAAAIHESHPEWLVRGDDGKITAPGAWGVVWADLTKLDYTHTDLWQYMADVFLLWCHRGVDGFRCDAGYMIPVDAWEYMVAKVRERYPDTLFFLEGLGGPMATTRDILTRANFNWAYSELFQNYTREQISDYLPSAVDISETCGHMIHFAETHDNNRLAAVSPVYARMRTGLCALFSVCGGFGFANGVEWFATQKINVHESFSLNWKNPHNQVDHISRLNLILKIHPAFRTGTQLKLIQQNRDQALVLLRHHPVYEKQLLILVNLDCDQPGTASWSMETAGSTPSVFYDLITGDTIHVGQEGQVQTFMLAPGQVLALSPDKPDLKALEQNRTSESIHPEAVLMQKWKAAMLLVYTAVKGFGDMGQTDVLQQAQQFARDPVAYIRSLNPCSNESRVIVFDVDKDLTRQVMIPPEFCLMIRSKHGFRAELMDESGNEKISAGYGEGLPAADQASYFAIFLPKKLKKAHQEFHLSLRMFEPLKIRIEKASVLYLAPFETLAMRSAFTRKEIADNPHLKLLATTKKGGMLRAAADWGTLGSRYDVLLGANLDPLVPENRWMVLSRYRIWAIFQGYSRELSLDCLEAFWFSYHHGGKWRFHVPTSEGNYYALELFLCLDPDSNHVHLSIHRMKARPGMDHLLNNETPVTLIIRPDIEDRSFHETVKAYLGPETHWPNAITPFDTGFYFSLSRGKTLVLNLPNGQFIHEPEWQYMVHRPLESLRGLDDYSDLFSPGYFSVSCTGGQTAVLDAAVIEKSRQPSIPAFKRPSLRTNTGVLLSDAVYKGLDAFIVERDTFKSVIAGYPWFLDWGRDSLIFCRSLIQTGRFSDARNILRLFGRFENNGTLPNMICGKDAGNIETSDAPLWFFTCCKDLIKAEGAFDFLAEDLDGRSVKQVLLSIARSLIQGTSTGVQADPDTLLLYSPAHFTWMDTNFPAGTPRQGYPVEIQALWHNALVFLSEIDDRALWQEKAQKVQAAIVRFFWNTDAGFFCDCLHADGPVGARKAVPDDALRPNQLLLATLDVIPQKELLQQSVETCLELLVPGGIRSLADRRLEYPLHIVYNNQLLKDPHFPYSGHYQGDEDTQRKPAYHNGTAWTWQFPVFCEAWAAVFGRNSYSTCLAWLGSVIGLMRTGAAGYLPEILDGDFPHAPRGCDAQAWSISEVARVVHKLTPVDPDRNRIVNDQKISTQAKS